MRIERKVEAKQLFDRLVLAVGDIFCQADQKVLDMIGQAAVQERNELAKDMLQSIVQNSLVAREQMLPSCQDTGTPVLFIRVGEDFRLINGSLKETIEQALEEAWQRYYLRRSLVEEPLFERKIIQHRAQPVLHWELVPGAHLELKLALKGGGAENMAALYMLPTSSKEDDIIDKVVAHVVQAGGKPCPPVLIGLGIGGNFEQAALLAKQALLEEMGRANPDIRYAELEHKILEKVNQEGKGVMGMGAGPTALAVHILHAPCHIASLPLAINLDCHAHRHTSFCL